MNCIKYDVFNQRMRNISVICMVLVVMIHSNVCPKAGCWQFVIMKLVTYIEKVAVPFFFVASGHFLAVRMSETGWYLRAVSKRLRTLMIPFFIWQICFLLFNVCLISIGALMGFEVSYDKRDFTLWGVLNFFGVNPFMSVNIVWYLRSVFLFVLISPLVAIGGAWMRIVILSVSFVIYIMHEAGAHSGDWYICFENFLPVRGLFFFCLGINIAKFGLNWLCNRNLLKIAVVTFIVSVGVTILGDGGGVIIEFVNSCGVVAMLVVLFNLIPSCRLATGLYGMVFPVYLLHLFVLIFFEKVSKVLGFFNWWHMSLIAFCVKTVIAIVVSCAIVDVMRKLLPGFSRMAFGGR